MSEKPHQEGAGAPDVSRETRDGSAEAPLNGSAGGSLGQTKPQEKNKRSSFFVYLAILFGAAFLMLLLAYFVQQRSNDDAMNNLRSTTTASRQELLEEIERLEKENQNLTERNEALSDQLDEFQEEIDILNEQIVIEHSDYVEYYDRFEVLQQFVLLEQALRNQAWDTAAKRVRALCSGVLELDSSYYELPGEPPFDPRARLEEIIPLLEKEGALTLGEVAVPGANASDG